jgi:hypothetical protein
MGISKKLTAKLLSSPKWVILSVQTRMKVDINKRLPKKICPFRNFKTKCFLRNTYLSSYLEINENKILSKGLL